MHGVQNDSQLINSCDNIMHVQKLYTVVGGYFGRS